MIPHRLPFTASNTAIRVFRHALSLDERRAKFKANHYNRPSEWEQQQGGIAAAGTATDVQTTVTVGSAPAQLTNSTASAGGYVMWTAEIALANLTLSRNSGHVNIAAEVGGARLATESFLVFSLPVCAS